MTAQRIELDYLCEIMEFGAPTGTATYDGAVYVPVDHPVNEFVSYDKRARAFGVPLMPSVVRPLYGLARFRVVSYKPTAGEAVLLLMDVCAKLKQMEDAS